MTGQRDESRRDETRRDEKILSLDRGYCMGCVVLPVNVLLGRMQEKKRKCGQMN